MSREELLEQHFERRSLVVRWGRGPTLWTPWMMRVATPLPPIAVLFPEPKPVSEPVRWAVLEEEPTLFETPAFDELVGLAGGASWNDDAVERLVESAGRVFDLALLARGLAVVPPRDRGRAVALDVVQSPVGGLMRVHTSSWCIVLASTLYPRARALELGGYRRVA